eukprot:6137723-Pyramimonas_sp.AAC.2
MKELRPTMVATCNAGVAVRDSLHTVLLRFTGPPCANNGEGALNTPEALPLFSPCVQFPAFSAGVHLPSMTPRGRRGRGENTPAAGTNHGRGERIYS